VVQNKIGVKKCGAKQNWCKKNWCKKEDPYILIGGKLSLCCKKHFGKKYKFCKQKLSNLIVSPQKS